MICLRRGLYVGRLVLCFPLGKDSRYRKIWICKCSCGNYCKRSDNVIATAISRNHDSKCRECNKEQALERLAKGRIKIQEYKLNLPKQKELFRRLWDKHHDLYITQYEPKEIFSLMREFVDEFGPVREWELGNENFSLDSVYEEEAKKIMIVKYCDICGEKLGEVVSEKNYATPQVKKHTFPPTDKRAYPVTLKIELNVTPTNAINCKEICASCVAKAVQDGQEVSKQP